MRRLLALSFVLAVALLRAADARAEEPPIDPDAIQELQEEAPALVATFLRAEKLAETEPATSLALYTEVGRKTSAFSEAHRRACQLALTASTRDEALRLCEGAIGRLRSPRNVMTLAQVYATKVQSHSLDEPRARALVKEALASPEADGVTEAEGCGVLAIVDPSEGERCARQIAEASLHTRRLAFELVLTAAVDQKHAVPAASAAAELTKLAPDAAHAWSVTAALAIDRGDLDTARRASAQLRVLSPRSFEGPHFESLVHELEGNAVPAERTLIEAERLGLAVAEVDRVRTRRAVRARAQWLATAPRRALAVIGGAWLLLLAASLAIAATVSRKLLAEITDGRGLPDHLDLSPARRRLRQLYGAALRGLAISFSGIWWTVASAVLFLVVLQPWRSLTGDGETSREPIVASGVLLAALLGSAWRLASPKPLPDPGLPLPLAEHPVLASILVEVAEAMGTRPITRVFLTKGEGLRIVIRGNLLADLRGTAEPCLIVGADALRRLDIQAFRAALAQAHVRLAPDEVPGATFALAVRERADVAHRAHDALFALHPARAWSALTTRLFQHVSHAAARFQLLRGDRLAVAIYGLDAFERSLAVTAPEAHADFRSHTTTRDGQSADPYREKPGKHRRGQSDGSLAQDTKAALPSAAERLERACDVVRRPDSVDFDEDAQRSAWLLLSHRREITKRLEALPARAKAAPAPRG